MWLHCPKSYQVHGGLGTAYTQHKFLDQIGNFHSLFIQLIIIHYPNSSLEPCPPLMLFSPPSASSALLLCHERLRPHFLPQRDLLPHKFLSQPDAPWHDFLPLLMNSFFPVTTSDRDGRWEGGGGGGGESSRFPFVVHVTFNMSEVRVI